MTVVHVSELVSVQKTQMVCDYDMGGGMKVIPPFFPERIIVIIIKFAYIMGASVTKLPFFVHKISFIIDALFQPLHETLYANHIVLIAEASEPFTSCMLCFGLSLSFTKQLPWRSSFRRPKRWKLEVLSPD